MKGTFRTALACAAALVACSAPAKESSKQNHATTGTNNATTGTNNVSNNPANNDGTCGGRLCPGQCLPDGDGWCVVEHFVGSFNIAMWAQSPDEIWLADQSGNVRVGSGTNWEEHPVPGIDQISDIIGTGSGQVWVTTYPTGVYRWDGGAWVEEQVVGLPADSWLNRLAYDETTDTLFVAGQHAIYQRVGQQWQFYAGVEGAEMRNVTNCGGTRWFAAEYPVTVDESGFASRWGVLQSNTIETAGVLASGEVVAGGSDVIFYDGAFKSVAASFLNRTHAVAGSSLTDMWSAVERSNATEIWHFDGRAWSLVKEYDNQRDVGSLYTEVAGRVRVTFQYGVSDILDAQGNVLETIGLDTPANNFEELVAHHVSMDEYWIADGGVARWTRADGWDTTPRGPSNPLSMWGSSIDDMWFVTSGGVIQRGDALDYQQVSTGFEQSENLTVVRGSETGQVWVAGSDQVLQWNGAEWVDHVGFDAGAEPNATPVALAAIGDEAWVFRRDDVFHWDGSQWNHVAPQRPIIQVGCEDDQLVAMANHPPGIYRGAPDRMVSFGDMAVDGSISTNRAWMTSESDAWVVTQGPPFVHRWSGEEFVLSLDNPQNSDQLNDIFVLPSGQAYLLGGVSLYTRQPAVADFEP